MLILATTGILRVITDAAVTVDVHASYVDRVSGNDTPGSQNTAISTATTTTIVSAPASGVRNIRHVSIRNRSSASSVTVTVQLYDSSTAYELDKRVLGPGQSLRFVDGVGWIQPSTGGTLARPWHGKIMGCIADGDPGFQMYQVQRSGWVGPTPTNIGATVARCCAFMPPADIVVNRLRFYGIGAVAAIYTLAVYRMSDLAQVIGPFTITTAANTWGSAGSAINVTLSKDTMYFVAVSANTTGTTAGLAAFGTTTTATTGQVQSTPAGLPGSMALGPTNYLNHYQFQFAVTAGALPATAATLALPSAWTGGFPAIWLDNADV